MLFIIHFTYFFYVVKEISYHIQKQSLRSSPLDEFTMCVLTNYKDMHHRELVIARPVPVESHSRDSSAAAIGNLKKERYHDSSSQANLFAAMNYGFYSPGFSQDLSTLRQELRLGSTALEQVLPNGREEDCVVRVLQTRLESHGVERSEQFVRSQIVLLHHLEGSVSATQALLSSPAAAFLSSIFQELCLLKDRHPTSSSREEVTAIHRFILKARCPLLYDRVERCMHASRGALVTVEISDVVSGSLLPLLSTVVDFIYSGSSSVDIFIVRFHILSEMLRCCEELNIHCGLLFREFLPVQSFRVISSDIDRPVEQIRPEILVSLCKDDEIWRNPFLSCQFAATLWDLDDLAARLQLPQLQAVAEKLIGASMTVASACQTFLLAKQRNKAELGQIISKFLTCHWRIIRVASINLLDESSMTEMEREVQKSSYQRGAVVLGRDALKAQRERLDSESFEQHGGTPSGSDSPAISIRDEFPFVAGKGDIPDSTSLPVYVGHSAVRIFDDQIMFIGGASTERYHPQSKILLYDIPNNEFKYVYCGGNGMSSSTGVQPSVALQKRAAYKLITGVGKAANNDQLQRYSSLPSSSVYRERQERKLSHNYTKIVPPGVRLSSLNHLSGPTSSSQQVATAESDGFDSEVSVVQSTDSKYYVNEIFHELDCRTLTWTDPSISVREALIDVGGSIMHPTAAVAGAHT